MATRMMAKNRNNDFSSSPIPTLPVAGSRISHIFAESIDSKFQ
jgi:hypothetical protein